MDIQIGRLILRNNRHNSGRSGKSRYQLGQILSDGTFRRHAWIGNTATMAQIRDKVDSVNFIDMTDEPQPESIVSYCDPILL